MDLSNAVKQAGVKIIAKNDSMPSVEKTESVDAPQMANDLMVSFFKLNPVELNQEVNRKLAFIHDWASQRSEDELGTISILKDIKYRLGATRAGTTEIDHVYNYVKLRTLAEESELRAKAMEK